jgi:hypothetical protein
VHGQQTAADLGYLPGEKWQNQTKGQKKSRQNEVFRGCFHRLSSFLSKNMGTVYHIYFLNSTQGGKISLAHRPNFMYTVKALTYIEIFIQKGTKPL